MLLDCMLHLGFVAIMGVVIMIGTIIIIIIKPFLIFTVLSTVGKYSCSHSEFGVFWILQVRGVKHSKMGQMVRDQ